MHLRTSLLPNKMSSGFVSGGTSDQPVERDSDWAKAQQEIAVARRRKEDEGKQEGGKSLFEVLQTNKGEPSTVRADSHIPYRKRQESDEVGGFLMSS